LRRIISTGAVLTALLGAVAALAASNDFNSYKATEQFCKTTPSVSSTSCPASKAGSKSKLAPFGAHELWTAKGLHGQNTAPLTDIVAKVYGEVTDAKDFPVCTSKMINNAGNAKGWNKVCPKGSLIAQGPVNALFVSQRNGSQPGAPQCNPLLNVYNGGVQNYKGHPTQEQVFFFTEDAQHQCLGGAVPTGSAPAYPGYITLASNGNGNTWTINIPQPPQTSTEAGGNKGVYASLVKLNVAYKSLSKRVHGKTVYYAASNGCKNGKRPYSFTFKAQNYNNAANQPEQPHTQTTTIKHTAPCS
jgi:hypothetical protein